MVHHQPFGALGEPVEKCLHFWVVGFKIQHLGDKTNDPVR